MSKLVQAISDAVQAGQNQDWAKLGYKHCRYRRKRCWHFR